MIYTFRYENILTNFLHIDDFQNYLSNRYFPAFTLNSTNDDLIISVGDNVHREEFRIGNDSYITYNYNETISLVIKNGVVYSIMHVGYFPQFRHNNLLVCPNENSYTILDLEKGEIYYNVFN